MTSFRLYYFVLVLLPYPTKAVVEHITVAFKIIKLWFYIFSSLFLSFISSKLANKLTLLNKRNNCPTADMFLFVFSISILLLLKRFKSSVNHIFNASFAH